MPLLIRHGTGSKEGNRSERFVSTYLPDIAICNLLRMLTRVPKEHILTVFLGLKQHASYCSPDGNTTLLSLESLDCWGSAQCINNKPNTVHNTTHNSPQILTSLHP
eukprot:scaffold30233_cov94-Skeletonema_dohrnii-CCMP3373.AAC.2